ncbi:cyanophycinase [Tepidanaerobacter sp. GT38]|uniref:cyanophycinase n=1 Tax=Tepidanaerobacter sp. GT38 TaxID=2722793 RepID=UPI001F01DE45|nr:cyanophycinase [Tepidanaerobacter sp. GT38]MCG1011966.1 cyanophycinase [Tepidanaerobacter sp. GT38]
MGEKSKGYLLLIGGAEDKSEESDILRKVVSLSGERGACLTILTVATKEPEKVGETYVKLFSRMGVKDVTAIDIKDRQDAQKDYIIERIEKSTGIFFTGGDQLRITSLIGGSRIYHAICDAYKRGVIICGTSAGASAMSDTMIVDGDGNESPSGSLINMAPGLGLLEEVVVDQHFAQRGRIGRLLTVVASNPYVLGVGIDEDTAILVNSKAVFTVEGSGTVTVIDGSDIDYTNVSELAPGDPLALFNAKIHVLSPGTSFDLSSRRPVFNKT